MSPSEGPDMCRLLAVAAAEPIPVRHALIDAMDSLQNQSARNMDGWGMAWYDDNGEPQVVKDFMPAALSSMYEQTAESVRTARLVGHVRAATKGGRGLANTHPFRIGRWVFAHNGTARGIEHYRDTLEAELPDALRNNLKGSTDSELMFHLIAARAGIGAGGEPPRSKVVGAIRDTIEQLAELSAEHGEKPATLNTILTDGRTLYVTRWGKGLWTRRAGRGSDRAGILPMALERTTAPRIDIASQPFTFDYAWREVPDQHLLVIGDDLATDSLELAAVV